MSVITLALPVLLQALAVSPGPLLRDPAYAPDGRIAVSIDGDLWVQRAAGEAAGWSRLTSGVPWDRHPAWSADGKAIVFVSDRGGNTDIWRIGVDGAAPTGAPERLTTAPDDDLEPSVGRDGTIVFTRGRGADARLWKLSAGKETRLTTGRRPERWGAISPDGLRVAYVGGAGDGARLQIRRLADTVTARDSVVGTERPAHRAAWAPDGSRLAFPVTGGRTGTLVAGADGRYANLAADAGGPLAWSPDGRTLAVAPMPSEPAGYNGDPERVGDRDAAEVIGATSSLLYLEAPAPPARDGRAAVVPAVDRASRNAELFDRAWRRIDTTYFAAPGRARERDAWRRLRDEHRPRALAAMDDLALERALHALVRARPTLRAEAAGRAAVSSAHTVASSAGAEILRMGGNVVDAAVATSFALGVVEPDASGIGGYGEMLIHLAGMERPVLIEFMARAPEEASLSNAVLMENGRYPGDGPVLTMVPGTVAGMHAAWKRFGSGKVSWTQLLAPAIRAAREGYVVSDGLATTLRAEREGFDKYEGSRAVFYRDGAPRAAGDTIRNPDLAWTLERIAEGGADAFYRGEIARRLVQDLRGKGNAIRLSDMARYFAAEREPVTFTYRGNTVYSSAPPAGGGAILAGQLSNLEQAAAPKLYTDDAASLHTLIAAWQLAPSSRGRIADPSLWPTTTEPFTSKDTARLRWRCFDPARALTPSAFRGDTLQCGDAPATAPAGASRGDVDARADAPSTPPGEDESPCGPDHAVAAPCRAQGTTSFTVGDADGSLVTVTQTLGTWGGTFYVTPGLGFLYNDKLTSYATDPSAYGARLPFARHGSTLAPTIVFRGAGATKRPWFALGAAGNAWITSAVYSGVVGMADLALGPQGALELPRFLPRQGVVAGVRSFVIDVESGLSPDVRRTLETMGYRFNTISLIGELRMGYGSAVLVDGARVRAGGDPRRGGAAVAVP